MRNYFVIASLFICVGISLDNSTLQAQLTTGWKAHDLNRPAPTVVDPGENDLPSNVPSDAVVLFDGTDLSNWADGEGDEAKWKIVDGAIESVPKSGFLYSRDKFGDCQLHIEWAAPARVKGKSQGRGNSGVFLMGLYEIQVLDSFENKTYSDGSAGSIYGQYPPLVNASRKPGEWQSYDIIFRQPKFDDESKLLSPSRVTVLHNGVLIQDNSKAFGPTGWIQHKEYPESHPTEGVLSLQDHGNPVRYRNIWIRPLAAQRLRPETPYATETNAVEISEDEKQRLVGKYGQYSVKLKDDTLFFQHMVGPLEMIPLSSTRFGFLKSAGSVEFLAGDDGEIQSLKLNLDAAGTKTANKIKASVTRD